MPQHYSNRVISNVSVNFFGVLGLYITLITETLKQKRLKRDCCKCVMRKDALLAGPCLGQHNTFTAKSNLKHVSNESFYENMVMCWL